MFWEDAAAGTLETIFGPDTEFLGVETLRAHLDGLIEVFGAGDFDGRRVEAREGWLRLGALGRSLGASLGYWSTFECGPAPILEIVVRKQRDYGSENIARFGRFGLLVRVHDKIARLENLLSSGSTPNNESILDNVIDVIGYSCVASMWEAGEFLYALQQSTVAESTLI
jgi:hypothetical protein